MEAWYTKPRFFERQQFISFDPDTNYIQNNGLLQIFSDVTKWNILNDYQALFSICVFIFTYQYSLHSKKTNPPLTKKPTGDWPPDF